MSEKTEKITISVPKDVVEGYPKLAELGHGVPETLKDFLEQLLSNQWDYVRKHIEAVNKKED